MRPEVTADDRCLRSRKKVLDTPSSSRHERALKRTPEAKVKVELEEKKRSELDKKKKDELEEKSLSTQLDPDKGKKGEGSKSEREAGIPLKPTPRRTRTVYSAEQIGVLEKAFEDSHYLSTSLRMELVERTKLTEEQVKAWFSNRRARHRKQQLSSAASSKDPMALPGSTPVASCMLLQDLPESSASMSAAQASPNTAADAAAPADADIPSDDAATLAVGPLNPSAGLASSSCPAIDLSTSTDHLSEDFAALFFEPPTKQLDCLPGNFDVYHVNFINVPKRTEVHTPNSTMRPAANSSTEENQFNISSALVSQRRKRSQEPSDVFSSPNAASATVAAVPANAAASANAASSAAAVAASAPDIPLANAAASHALLCPAIDSSTDSDDLSDEFASLFFEPLTEHDSLFDKFPVIFDQFRAPFTNVPKQSVISLSAELNI